MALTDDDKNWFGAQLAEIKELHAKQDEKIERVETSLLTEFHKRLAILDEKIERVETSLLTEFHKWASPVEMRQRTHAATLRSMDVELEALADRVTKLERPH